MKSIEKIKKTGKRLGLAGLVLAGSLMLASCGSSGSGSPGKKNKAPTMDIGESFGDGLSGKVTYLLSASDPDGSVKDVYVKSNGSNFLRLENGEIIQYDIEPGDNTVEAYAVDNEGKTSQTATRSFYSPVDEDLEVDPVIEGILGDRGYVEGDSLDANTFKKNSFFGTSSGDIIADYLITRSNGSRIVIEYIGHADDLQTELDEKAILDDVGSPNLYLARVPLEEVESTVNYFADNNGL